MALLSVRLSDMTVTVGCCRLMTQVQLLSQWLSLWILTLWEDWSLQQVQLYVIHVRHVVLPLMVFFSV